MPSVATSRCCCQVGELLVEVGAEPASGILRALRARRVAG